MPDALIYAASNRCPCGAGLAYRNGGDHWDCSAILDGTAIPRGHEGAVQHTDTLPFIFWEIKSENQPSANGASTRPSSWCRRRVVSVLARSISTWTT